MTSPIEITATESKIRVASPYNPEFPARARALGGKWEATQKVWSFDRRDEDRVRALCLDIYGTDGRPLDTSDLVTLRVTLEENRMLDADQSALFFAGREIGRAFDRDSGARIADGIVFLEGDITSGGSRKNWDTRTTDGAIFEIRDLPRAAAEKAIRERDEYRVAKVEIIDRDTTAEDRRAALQAERQALLARLAEINTELGDQSEPTKPAATEKTTTKPAATFAILAMATGFAIDQIALTLQLAADTATGQLHLFI